MLPEPRKLQLLTYEYVPDMLERRDPHRDAHLAQVAEWEASGRLLLVGATGDPPSGAILIFDCPVEEVEGYAQSDPYRAAGLITSHRVEPMATVAFSLPTDSR